jgi:5-methylthioadenosine/S-adenosylhomocysteine deaminase
VSVADGRTLLVEGGHVATMYPARRVLEDGFVLVRDGAIEAVGSAGEKPDVEPDERIDARGCIVVPGLINTHQHHWYNLFKGLGGGMLLEQWIQNLLVPTARAITPHELEVAGRLACVEMLTTGTTACLNHSVSLTGLDEVEATVRPVVESGMRQLFAKEIRPDPIDEQLALAEEVHRRFDGAGDGRIRIGFVIESTAHWVAMGTCSEELVVRGNELADRLGVRVGTHTAGGTMSRDSGYLKFVLDMGRTDFEFLQKLGVLDHKWVLAHAIHARDHDIELIAASGATVSHTPTSESARGGGITPVARMRKEGILVALGTDGPMVDTSVDMVEQMKVVTLFQNQLHNSGTAIRPLEALAMATIDAAEMLGLAGEIGSLEPGKRADIAVFDLATPHSAIWHEPVAALVGSARGTDAKAVVVDGEVLLRDGAPVRYDADAVAGILVEARACADELLARTDVPAHRSGERESLPAIV